MEFYSSLWSKARLWVLELSPRLAQGPASCVYGLCGSHRAVPPVSRGPCPTYLSDLVVLHIFMFLNKGARVVFWIGAIMLSSEPGKQLRPANLAHAREMLRAVGRVSLTSRAALSLFFFGPFKGRFRPWELMSCPGECGSFSHPPMKSF